MGRDDRQAQLLAQLEVLGAAAGGDVDDPRPLLLADLVPRDHPVLVRAGARFATGGEGVRHGRQVVVRALVAPADEVRAGPAPRAPRTAPTSADLSVPRPSQRISSPWRTLT